MSLETTIAALVSAANNLTGAVNGKMTAINNTLAAAVTQFDTWRNLKDVEGTPGKAGTIRRNIFQGQVFGTGLPFNVQSGDGFDTVDLGTSLNVYVHFKLPLNVNRDVQMFWFNIKGYSYGSSKIVEETIVGYCYKPQLALINTAAFGNMTPAVYKATNGDIILRLLIPSIYYTTFRIDTMQVGDGVLFNLGDIKTKLSLSDTVVFA